jgi:hypothetical protein
MEEVMASKLALDPRVDPRIKAVFATFELPTPTSVASREELLAEEAAESATARAEDRVPGRGVRAWLVIALSGGSGRFVSLPRRAS